MNKSENFHKNKTHKILWDFEIQTDYPVLTRREDLLLIKKELVL